MYFSLRNNLPKSGTFPPEHPVYSIYALLVILQPNQTIARNDRVGRVLITGDRRGAYIVLVGRPKGKSLLGRPQRRWEDNIKMGLKEVGMGRQGLY